ncbi:MAG: hypothetical protein ACRD3A_07840 [Terriglobales bacterium]
MSIFYIQKAPGRSAIPAILTAAVVLAVASLAALALKGLRA